MILEALALYEQVSVVVKGYLNKAAHGARVWLGPEPEAYYLLPDGQVLPTTVVLPESVFAKAYVYNPDTQRITLASNTNPDGRFRPLAYLAVQVAHPDTGTIDMSDWLGDVRANPVPELSSQQLITLWSYTHNRYVPFCPGTTITVAMSDGTEASTIL